MHQKVMTELGKSCAFKDVDIEPKRVKRVNTVVGRKIVKTFVKSFIVSNCPRISSLQAKNNF